MKNNIDLNKPTTLKDVAKLAGVSAMTVSNALNHKGSLSSQTYEKIMKAVKELNYTPNQVAQSLRNSKSNTIGVVMSDASCYVFSEILKGITAAAAQHNYNILLSNTVQDPSVEAKAIDLLLSSRIDGLIIVAPLNFSQKDIEHLKSLNIPFVILMRTSPFTDAEYVVNDNFSGSYQSLRYLYDTGSRDFFFMTIDSSSGYDRIRGYSHFLSEHGLNFQDFPRDAALPQIQDGYNSMKKIIQQGFHQGAVCCGCDLMAIGAMNAILEAGFSIPGDFRLIGYDDLEMSQYLRVPLTTVRQPFYQIGQEGVRVLQNRLMNSDSPMQSVILQPELIIRQST
ncbi:MAG: LacI family DNA-binding transcriptional regulator [Lachnoclostridium edouardi]|uniref:LacI family DNA-binding transcriptional regulator n=1 Tax=Lachnoclostridium edouardi TaxID=1926283 RepID=UPI0026DCD9BC|nr:LacI family DNA-binding transcriptional regulator [Lachnoclostridium edouardi]MDO4277218.1 LacI family DNA-binding transcriptional regulator [Lachnoclostridium edouardi]